MAIFRKSLYFKTKGNGDIIEITPDVKKVIYESDLKSGIVNVFVVGSTASIITIEYESGLIKDLINILDKLIPYDKHYEHHKRWNDDNAHSHIRASFFGSSVTAPFTNSNLLLGTWQQIVLVDFDTRPREREVIISCIGE